MGNCLWHFATAFQAIGHINKTIYMYVLMSRLNIPELWCAYIYTKWVSFFASSRHFFIPEVPAIPGLQSFPGRIIHSHVYREPEAFRGETVLVVGVGQSGRDLIIDLAGHAREVWLSNRGAPLTCSLPSNVHELPAIKEMLSDGNITFSNGETRHIDSIILATGYLYSFPFLSEKSGLQVLNDGKRVFPLYKQTFNARHPSSAIIGVNFGVTPFPYFDLQVRWVLSVWTGEKLLPSVDEMIKNDEETFQRKLREGLPPHKAGHFLGPAQWDLYRELAILGGNEPLAPVNEMLYNESGIGRKNNLMHYKKANYVVLGEDKFARVEDSD